MKTTRKLILDGETYEAALALLNLLEGTEDRDECIMQAVLEEATDEYESRYYPIEAGVDEE